MTADDEATLLAAERQHLTGIAYRMLGSVADAEDAVQETYARWLRSDTSDVDNPAAWLTTTCTRICLDRLKAASTRRETYVGPWLPEPLLTDDVDVADAAAVGESLTLAFLVVLESLSPLERAAFLLHDVFGHPHAEVATALDRSEPAVRQLVSRARAHVEERRPRYEADRERRWDVAHAFLEAAATGDAARLMTLLAPDVVLTSDGGGIVSAARRPLHGPDVVARFLLGIQRAATHTTSVEPREVNGMPGLLVRAGPDVIAVFSLTIDDGRIAAIHAIRNPEKLTHVR